MHLDSKHQSFKFGLVYVDIEIVDECETVQIPVCRPVPREVCKVSVLFSGASVTNTVFFSKIGYGSGFS